MRVSSHSWGRPLLEEDEGDGTPPVAVIGYDVWQSRFSGGREAVGQAVQLGGVDHVVVGIMPEDFRFPLWYFVQPNFVGRGFASEEYVTARIALDDGQPAGAPSGADPRLTGRLHDLQAELVRQVRDGIGASGATLSAWIDGVAPPEWIGRIETDVVGQEPVLTRANHVDEAFFDVFGAWILAGRAFETADFNPGRPVVIVSRTFAGELSGQNPLGTRVRDRRLGSITP